MDYGVAIFSTDYSVEPGRFARLAEERGYEAVFFPEHTHIPVDRETPFPDGGDLPKEYWHTYDLFVGLTAAAAATHTIKVGSGICLITERDPIITAKAVASIDALSGGRLIFGVGAGWNREEMRNHGTDPERRFGLMHERLQAMKTIWMADEAEYHGKYVHFDPIWCWPKPVQKPHPPVMIGGMGRRVVERVLRDGDGWFPEPLNVSHEEFMARLRELPAMAAETGRRVPQMTVFGATPEPDLIADYAAVGVTRTVFWLPPLSEDEAAKRLDEIARRLGNL